MPRIRIRNIRIFVDSDCVHDSDCMFKIIEKIAASQSKTWLAFCFSFIVGVAVFSWAEGGEDAWPVWLYFFLFLTLAVGIFFWKNRRARLVIFCLSFFIFGALRLLWALPSDTPADIKYYNNERVEIYGRISREPALNTKGVRYVLDAESVIPKDRGGMEKKVAGRLSADFPAFPRFAYGDSVRFVCLLSSPTDYGGMSYERYLASRGIQSVCYQPRLLSFSVGSRSVWGEVLRFKGFLNERIERLWNEPESSLLAGLLYGERTALPETLKDSFNRAGLSHLVAVSGYNISIVAAALLFVLIALGLYRQQAFYFSSFGIFLFVMFVGAPASALRAGLLAFIVLLGARLGRATETGRALFFAAAAMLMFSPLLLIWDTGFQLSFLAVIGLVYVSPLLSGKKEGEENGIKAVFMDATSTTLSAIIITLPLILYKFGRLSFSASVANPLVLWIIPAIMFFGFLAIVLSFIFYPLGQIIAWVVGLFLKYVIMVATYFGEERWSLDAPVPATLMIGLYAILAFVYLRARRRLSLTRKYDKKD